MPFVNTSRSVASPWGVSIGFAIVAGAAIGPLAILPALWIVGFAQAVARRWNWWLMVFVGLAVVLGAVRSASIPAAGLPVVALESRFATGKVVSMTRGGQDGGSVLVEIDSIGAESDRVEVDHFVVWVRIADHDDVSRGDRVALAWNLSPLIEVSPGYASYVKAQGAVATAYAWQVDVLESGPALFRVVEDVRDRVTIGLMDVLPGDRGALAAGIVTGDDSGLSGSARKAFRETGTSHITAVSGSNVAMVVSLWAMLVPFARGRRLLAVQIVIIASVWLYALLTGLEPPVARAATMSTLMLLGSHVGRRPDPMTLLALTSAAMVLWNPHNVELIAFWLSVVATGAIISRIPQESGAETRDYAVGIIQGVVLAQLVTLPLVLITFGTWSLVSILTNILLAPLMLLAFPLCFLLGGVVLASTTLASLLAWIPGLFLGVALQIVNDFADLVPPVTIDQPGLAGTLLFAIPCILGMLLLTRDGNRWLSDIEFAWRRQPALIAIIGTGSIVGVLGAILLALFA